MTEKNNIFDILTYNPVLIFVRRYTIFYIYSLRLKGASFGFDRDTSLRIRMSGFQVARKTPEHLIVSNENLALAA